MKHGPVQYLRYLLNYDRTVVHLQADLEKLPALKDISPFTAREMRINDENDIVQWLEVVNDAYNDTNYDLNYLNKHITNHLFLDISNIYMAFDGDIAVGTISIGTYKSNKKVGGDARVAVRKKYQGKGLGIFLITYGFQKLRESHIRYGESIISIIRDKSILLHFKCGFVPQVDRNYIQYKDQKRFFIIRWLVNNKLKKMYQKYLSGF